MTDPNINKPQIRGHCPNCGPGRFADVRSEFIDVEEMDDDSGMWARTTSRILQCAGCKSVYFQEIYIHSEDYDYDNEGHIRPNEKITYYPAPAKRIRPDWVSLFDLEEGLFNLLEETYNALDVDARVLTATGARTVFDRAAELLGINPGLTFKEKLSLLRNGGHVGEAELNHLDLLTDAGGAAAHRGWRPSPTQIDAVMSIVEAFIYRSFVLEAKVKKLKGQIPERQKSQNKA